MPTRRAVLGGIASAALAGCGAAESGVPDEADVVAGADSRLAFEPETLAVGVGETVTWYFASAEHNVCGVPAHHDRASLPADAEPFASYPGEEKHQTDSRGSTYEHAFETPGEYRYVCVPHAPTMTGRLRVE